MIGVTISEFDFTDPTNKDMTHEITIDAKFQDHHDIVLDALTDHQLVSLGGSTRYHRLSLVNDATGKAEIVRLEEGGESLNDGDVDHKVTIKRVEKKHVVGEYGWCENFFVKWVVEDKGIALGLTSLILYGYIDDDEFQAQLHHLTVWKTEPKGRTGIFLLTQTALFHSRGVRLVVALGLDHVSGPRNLLCHRRLNRLGLPPHQRRQLPPHPYSR